MLKEIVATSDRSNPVLMLGLLIVTGLILVGYLVYKVLRKKK